MDTAALKARMVEAQERVSATERDLEEQLRGLTDANGGETTIVAQLLEGAFSALRAARKNLVDATALLEADEANVLVGERSCPGCQKTVRTDALVCGHCGKKLGE